MASAAQFRMRNRELRAVIESPSGTAGSPAAADAIRVANLAYNPKFETLNFDDEVTGSLSVPPPVTGGGFVEMQADWYMKGSGTAGTAPQWDRLIRACAFSVTTTGAPVTGTAQAGAATSITLAAGASAVNDAYKGMVIRTTGGTGPNQSAVITGYVGSTKVATVAATWGVTPDATTTYSIDANVLYKPISSGFETLSMWEYIHNNDPASNSRLRKMIGAAGLWKLALTAKKFAKMSGTFTGNLPAAPTDVAKPSAAVYDSANPQPYLNAETLLGGVAVKFRDFSLDVGSKVAIADDPSAAYGVDIIGQITQRKPAGKITPYLTSLSSYNAFSNFLNSTQASMVFRWGAPVASWGSNAGNRISILLPIVNFTGNEDAKLDDFEAEGIPIDASGNDAEIYISVS